MSDVIRDFFQKVVGTAQDAAKTLVDAATGKKGASDALSLGSSVGKGGKNKPEDVKVVQKALGIADSGDCDKETVEAIKAFQKTTLGHKKPDGRVDVGGPTAKALAGHGGNFMDTLKDLGGKIVDGAKELGGQIIDAAAKATVEPVLDRIVVEPSMPDLVFGKQQQFTATGYYSDESERDLTNSVHWGTQDSKFVTINKDGLATAQSVAGSTGITAMDPASGKNDSTSVTVISPEEAAAKPLKAIGLNDVKDTLIVGQKSQFTATGMFKDGSSRDVTKKVYWESSDEEVLSVDEGVVKAGSKEGKATITASDNDNDKVSRSVEVTVTNPKLTTLSIDPKEASARAGEQHGFMAEASFADGSEHSLDGRIVWSTSAPDIAKIDQEGIVTTQGKLGTVTIRAKDPLTGVTASAKLTVTAPAKGVKKVNVQFLVKDFKGQPMLDGGFSGAIFDAAGAQQVQATGEISHGVLTLANLLLLPKGNVTFFPDGNNTGAGSYLVAYELPKSGDSMTFSAVQKSATGRFRGKTQEEAVKKSGAPGAINKNIEVVNLGNEVNGENEWQLTWGTDDYEVKQT